MGEHDGPGGDGAFRRGRGDVALVAGVHADDVPEDPVGEVGAVQQLVGQDATRSGGSGPGPGPRVVGGEGEPSDGDIPEPPARDELVQPRVGRGEPHVVRGVEPDACLLGRGDDLGGLPGVRGQRFLAHDTDTGGDGGHGDFVVRAGRRADVDGVGAVEGLGQRPGGGGPELLRELGTPAVIGVDPHGGPGAEPRFQV
nr:NADH-dependent dihydrogenase [uncultured bacterium]